MKYDPLINNPTTEIVKDNEVKTIRNSEGKLITLTQESIATENMMRKAHEQSGWFDMKLYIPYI
jgi:hypothetical protein